jgi:hypothetical protein
MRKRGMFRALVLTIIALWTLSPAGRVQPPAEDWQLLVLGIAQDGGIPQLGCDRPLCQEIRAGRRRAEKVSSLGLVNR